MKYVDEFRDPARARVLCANIRRLVKRIGVCRERPLQLMEVCGGHTHSIFRYGIENMLPKEIELVHGPGCPVCVLPMGRVDDEVIFTTFGDAMRVPGSRGSLLETKARGADVRMVYSPMDALELARRLPDREVVFFGLGFETTMPSTALTVLQAERENIGNFSLFCNHITIPIGDHETAVLSARGISRSRRSSRATAVPCTSSFEPCRQRVRGFAACAMRRAAALPPCSTSFRKARTAASASGKPPCRCAMKSEAYARFGASIRFTSPTKARWLRSSRKGTRRD